MMVLLTTLVMLDPESALRERGSGTASQEVEFVVVAHDDLGLEDLSSEQLRRIFLGERQYWDDGSRILTLIGMPGTAGRATVLELICDMTEAQYREYWIAKIFRTQATSGPRVLETDAALLSFVSRLPGSIAVVPASPDTDGVRILSIDGLKPGAPGYPLRKSPS
jgi:hypothetical protein